MRKVYRCETCLCVFAIGDTNLEQKQECGICKGIFLEFMGKVQGDSLVKDRCKCDDRCVWASGPCCDCICGGANHNSGQEGYTLVKVDPENRITIFDCNNPDIRAKHLAIADEFKALKTKALDKLTSHPNWTKFIARDWIDRPDWEKLFYGKKELYKICQYKTQGLRVKKLQAWIDSF